MATGQITGNIQTTIAGNISTGTSTAFIPEIWSRETLDALEFAAVIAKRVNRQFQGELKVGDTVHVSRISNMTATDKTPGTDVSFEYVTEGTQDVTACIWKYAAFLVEDLVPIQANVDLRAKYTKKIAYALNRAVETNLSGIFDGLTNTQGTLGVELTTDDYLSAYQTLAEAGLLENDPDPGENFSVILSPAAYVAAMKVDVFTNRDYNPRANAVQAMSIGDIYGFPTFRSNLLESDSAGQHDCIMMHRDCFALIMPQNVKIESDHLIEKVGDAVVGTIVFGAAEMNFPPETAGGGAATDNRGVYLKTV